MKNQGIDNAPLPEDTEGQIKKRIANLSLILKGKKPKGHIEAYQQGVAKGLYDGARIALQHKQPEPVSQDAQEQIDSADAAIATLIRLFPPEKNGEDEDCVEIYETLKGMRDFIALTNKQPEGDGELVGRMREAIMSTFDEDHQQDIYNQPEELQRLEQASVRCAAIAQSLPGVKGEGWRPIEEAPRDGTLVDLWVGESFLAYRIPESKYEYGEWWYAATEDGECVWNRIAKTPTHFIPIPQPPKQSEQ